MCRLLFLSLLLGLLLPSCTSLKKRPAAPAIPARVMTITSVKPAVTSVQKSATAIVHKVVDTQTAAAAVKKTVEVIWQGAPQPSPGALPVDRVVTEKDGARLVTEVDALLAYADASVVEAKAHEEKVTALESSVAQVERERDTAWLEREELRVAAEKNQTHYIAEAAVRDAEVAQTTEKASSWRKRALWTWSVVAGLGVAWVLMRVKWRPLG